MKLPRFYPILDTATAERRGMDAVAAAEAILEAGAAILQYRHKPHFTRAAFEQAERIADLARSAGAVMIVDDRADVAQIVRAGLHLGQEDMPVRLARRLVSDSLLGFSTHNEDQLRAAASEPADYLALGPIFGTLSKDRADPVVGLDGLRRLRYLTDRPLVAIGGITRATAHGVIAAGADSVAVIGDLFPEPCSREAMILRVREWLAAVEL